MVRHLRLQTDVVVKKIKDEVCRKVKSLQEADILKNLNHPYLLRVYDFIETEDVCLIDFNFSLDMGESMESALGISAGFSPPEQYRDSEMYARIIQIIQCGATDYPSKIN